MENEKIWVIRDNQTQLYYLDSLPFVLDEFNVKSFEKHEQKEAEKFVEDNNKQLQE